MDLGPLRALALDLNLDAHGVDVMVTVDGGDPIETRGIWVTPATDGFPGGSSLQRHEPVRIMAIRRDDVPRLPNGSIVVAPRRPGDADERWQVEGTDRVEEDHRRVILIAAPDEET